VPCSTDAECTTMSSAPNQAGNSMTMTAAANATRGFEACEMGKCVFVGCETNAECRALLGLENQRSNVQAVCR
jgi:hypothetical protein